METQIFSTAKFISNSSEQELYHSSEEMTIFLLVVKQKLLIFQKIESFSFATKRKVVISSLLWYNSCSELLLINLAVEKIWVSIEGEIFDKFDMFGKLAILETFC